MFPIFDKLGGHDAAIKIIRKARGLREDFPSAPTLELWKRNRKLPGRNVLVLMEECEKRGIRYKSSDFRMA